MRRTHPLLILAFALGFSTSPSAAAGEPFRFPEGRHAKGELKYFDGIPVLILDGTAEQIAEQTAFLIAKPSARLLKFPQEALERMATPVGAKLLLPSVIKTGYRLFDNFPEDYRREFEAMAKFSGYDRELLLLGNTVFDQKHLLGALFGCSAIVVEKERSRTGQPIFGRNMDYLSLGYLQDYSLVTVFRQPGKRSIASVGYPGLLGVISGINDAGLAVAALETTGSNKEEGPVFSPDGVPFALIYRRILEECSSVDEAAKLLTTTKRTTSNHLTVCDRNGGAVFEFTPNRVVVRRAESGTCRCTNHFISSELRLREPRNLFATLDRLAMLDKCCAVPGMLGPDELKKYLHNVNQGDLTLQSMIFEPASLKLHLAIADGKSPATGQPYRTLHLTPLFQGGP